MEKGVCTYTELNPHMYILNLVYDHSNAITSFRSFLPSFDDIVFGKPLAMSQSTRRSCSDTAMATQRVRHVHQRPSSEASVKLSIEESGDEPPQETGKMDATGLYPAIYVQQYYSVS